MLSHQPCESEPLSTDFLSPGPDVKGISVASKSSSIGTLLNGLCLGWNQVKRQSLLKEAMNKCIDY